MIFPEGVTEAVALSTEVLPAMTAGPTILLSRTRVCRQCDSNPVTRQVFPALGKNISNSELDSAVMTSPSFQTHFLNVFHIANDFKHTKGKATNVTDCTYPTAPIKQRVTFCQSYFTSLFSQK